MRVPRQPCKGLCSKAQGWPAQPGYPGLNKQLDRTLKGFCRTSIPNVAFIEVNSVLPEQAPELVLERFFPMVLLLIPNVFLQSVEMRRAHRECAVASLPIECLQFLELLLYPRRRRPLELLDEIGRRQRFL